MRPVPCVVCAALLSLYWPSLGESTASRQVETAEQAPSTAFEALKRLAGTWSGTVKTEPATPDLDGPIQVTMRVASQGNVLLHEIAPGGMPEPTTIYLDGGRLTLVHYCDAGNRPRLVTRPSADPKTVRFDFMDISGSRSPLYLQQLVFTLVDADHHAEDWTFVLTGNKALHAHFDVRRTSGVGPEPPGQ